MDVNVAFAGSIALADHVGVAQSKILQDGNRDQRLPKQRSNRAYRRIQTKNLRVSKEIPLADHVGVAQSKILHSKSDMDTYFLN